jgi:hypothetical protein
LSPATINPPQGAAPSTLVPAWKSSRLKLRNTAKVAPFVVSEKIVPLAAVPPAAVVP